MHANVITLEWKQKCVTLILNSWMRILMRPAGPADPIEGDAPSGRSALMLQHQRHREYASKARQAGIIAMLKPMLWYYGEH